MKFFFLIALLLCLASSARSARADLRGDADILAAVFTRSGASVTRRAPVFLEAGQAQRLHLGQPMVAGTCATLVALAARPLRLALDPLRDGQPVGASVTSQAGALVVEDCDGTLLGGEGLLRLEAGRGAVEILIVRHETPLSRVDTILPARAVGAVPPRDEDAGPLTLAPAIERLARARKAAELDGAEVVVPVVVRADDQGQQVIVLNLGQGCHRLLVIADQDSARGPVDVDAEAVMAEGGTLLRRDRSHAPDARLDFCIGEVTRVEVRMVGAGGDSRVTILDALWSLPPGLPSTWGASAKAGLAWALHRRRAPRLEAAPVAQFVGAPGATLVPIDLETDACYVAAYAMTRGGAFVGRLTVSAAGDTRYDDAAEEPHSAAVTFCANGSDRAVAQVDLRADSSFWVLAVWRLGDAP